jgi:hypothetical protein
MKCTDFSMRTSALEFYLSGLDLIGAEVGSDVGAHAESILTNCSINKLHLVDIWDNSLCEGICRGRLYRWYHRVEMHKGKSNEVVKRFGVNSLDFVYIDAEHDYNSVREDLSLWWVKIRYGSGVLALRNYNGANEGLFKAANEFLEDKHNFKVDDYHNELIVFK